jgi:hypothetical protein
MKHLLLPIVFLLGALSGGAVIWRWRGRRGSDGGVDGGLGRWAKVKLVAATAVTTALILGAVGYGLVRHRFGKTQATRATVNQAVSDFRKTRKKGKAPGPERGKAPPPGVYQYAATGFYEVEVAVLGKDRRVLPKTVPAVLVSDGDCWELTLRYFAQHHWTARYCRSPRGGLRFVWAKNKNEFFAMKNRSHTFCTPDVILRPGGLPGPGPGSEPGTEWKEKCRRNPPSPHDKDAKIDVTVRYVGVETVLVGATKVEAYHMRSAVKMKASVSGTFHQDFWYARGSGMLVKLRAKGEASGMAKFVSDYQLTLKSLSPTR